MIWFWYETTWMIMGLQGKEDLPTTAGLRFNFPP
jgi:hypothetical protein